MEYKGTDITFDNLRTVLEDFSVDIQDEVRSALLDGTDIEWYIDKFSDNPYGLQQMRLYIKEGHLPNLVPTTDGGQIRQLRALIARGVDVTPYANLYGGLPTEVHQAVLDMLDNGMVIPQDVDFCYLRQDLLGLVKQRIANREEVGWLMDVPKDVELGYVVVVDKLLRAEIIEMGDVWAGEGEVGGLLQTPYRLESLEALKESNSIRAAKEVFPHLTPDTDGETTEMLLTLSQKAFNHLDEVAGLPGYQLAWIYDAYRQGMDWRTLTTEGLSNGELSDIFTEQIAKGTRRLKGRL